MKHFKIRGEFTKADSELGLAFGWAIVCTEKGEPYFDLQGDHIPEESMLKAAAAYMEGARVGGRMHKADPVDAMLLKADELEKVTPRGRFTFAFPLTEEVAKAYGIQCERTGLLVAMKADEDVLEEIKAGELTGFSIGGFRGEDEEIDE